METDKKGEWNPYLAGSLTGLVCVLSVWVTGKYFGASTTFVRWAGSIEKIFAPERLIHMDYFHKYTPEIDWQWMFVIGILVGSLVSSLSSRTFEWKAVPDMWQARFGQNPIVRGVVAFLGGAVAIFGARLAGGCTSGHGLSGSLQLAVSGFITIVCFFVGGILVARALYGGGRPK